eukprot:g37849.t1
MDQWNSLPLLVKSARQLLVDLGMDKNVKRRHQGFLCSIRREWKGERAPLPAQMYGSCVPNASMQQVLFSDHNLVWADLIPVSTRAKSVYWHFNKLLLNRMRGSRQRCGNPESRVFEMEVLDLESCYGQPIVDPTLWEMYEEKKAVLHDVHLVGSGVLTCQPLGLVGLIMGCFRTFFDKVFARALLTRLCAVLDHMMHTDQIYTVPGQIIHDNIHLLWNVICPIDLECQGVNSGASTTSINWSKCLGVLLHRLCCDTQYLFVEWSQPLVVFQELPVFNPGPDHSLSHIWLKPELSSYGSGGSCQEATMVINRFRLQAKEGLVVPDCLPLCHGYGRALMSLEKERAVPTGT